MKKLLSLSVLGFMWASCEKTIDFEIPYDPPKITIDAKIIAGDTIQAIVGLSKYSMSPGDPVLDDASTVYLYENNIPVDTLESVIQPWSSAPYYKSDYIPVENKRYTVEAIRANYPNASGSEFLKSSVSVTQYRYDTASSDFTVHFQDPPGKGDYYRIRFIPLRDVNDSLWDMNYDAYFSTYDPTVEIFEISDFLDDIGSEDDGSKSGQYGYLSDEYFDGKTKKIDLTYLDFYFDGNGDNQTFYFEIMRISESYYRHERSKGAQQGENPFTEPTPIFSNIDHGYGIVATGAPTRVLVNP